jgi:hypothetical protein
MSVVEREIEVVAPAETDEVAEVLERAADLLVRDGWCQEIMFHSNGSRCARGAILDAGKGTGLCVTAMARLNFHLGLERCSIETWNDSMCMTADVVVRALKEAAAKETE